MNNQNVPKVRFKGFTDPWEQRKLSELGEIITGSTPSTQHSEYYSDNGILWVTPTDISDNITYETARKLSKEGEKVARVVPSNTILVTCIASIGKNTMLGTTGSFNQQINALVPNQEKYNPYFLFTESSLWSKEMQSIAAQGTMQIINKTEFSALTTYAPTLDEQKQIGSYFANLDNLITLHQRKCDTLQKLKKSMLQKMFPKNGESFPEIRFEGFTDAWEQRELGELMKENQKPIPKPNGEYTRLGIRSHAKGTFHEVVPEGGGLDVDTMYVVEANNLIVNITFAWEEAWAITTDEDAEKLVSHRFPQYKFNPDQYPVFYKYRFNNSRMKYNLELASPGGAGRNRVLNKGAFLKIPVDIPNSFEEQKRIGSYFANLDNLITLHQRKLETLKKLKKAMLQKMFV